MSFLGVGPLELLLIFAVAMFFVGPKRLAEGVRNGRKYYTEFKRQRDELTSLVSEAIDAEELKKEFEETKREAWDESATREITDLQKDMTLDQGDLDLGLSKSVEYDSTSSRPKPTDRGNGKIGGKEIPSIGLSRGPSSGPPGSPTEPSEPDVPEQPGTRGDA